MWIANKPTPKKKYSQKKIVVPRTNKEIQQRGVTVILQLKCCIINITSCVTSLFWYHHTCRWPSGAHTGVMIPDAV